MTCSPEQSVPFSGPQLLIFKWGRIILVENGFWKLRYWRSRAPGSSNKLPQQATGIFLASPMMGSRPELAWYPVVHSAGGVRSHSLFVSILLPSFLYREYLPPPSLLVRGGDVGGALWGARDVGRSLFWFSG